MLSAALSRCQSVEFLRKRENFNTQLNWKLQIELKTFEEIFLSLACAVAPFEFLWISFISSRFMLNFSEFHFIFVYFDLFYSVCCVIVFVQFSLLVSTDAFYWVNLLSNNQIQYAHIRTHTRSTRKKWKHMCHMRHSCFGCNTNVCCLCVSAISAAHTIFFDFHSLYLYFYAFWLFYFKVL